jgi:coenzyme F420-reducing hydrogenase gamma subunit
MTPDESSQGGTTRNAAITPGTGAEPAAPSAGGSPPTVAVWKFASCDGCQLSLLNREDELLTVAGAIRIAHFPEATRAHVEGPYDVSLVEGSVTTAEDIERVRRVRAVSRVLVAIGACATSGGIQALRNFTSVEEYRSLVYANPEYVATLDRSTPISAHVTVDFELRGCPIDAGQLVEVISAFVAGRRPRVPRYSVCAECKRRGLVCLMVAHGTPCLGPITQAGCGAVCPATARGCYGCFGPQDSANVPALTDRLHRLGLDTGAVVRALRTYNAGAEAFRRESLRLEEMVQR